MTWTLSRLGSRFALVFEPFRRRVLHASLGRYHDLPLDLKVGFVEPDGTERVLPFTRDGVDLDHCEQFDRLNSITYRGFSRKSGLRFELNIHSPFYPQDQRLCSLPAFYLELRVNPTVEGRWHSPDDLPEKVRVFFRVRRPDTKIAVQHDPDGRAMIEMRYRCPTQPRTHYDEGPPGSPPGSAPAPESSPRESVGGDSLPGVEACDKIVSLTGPCCVHEDGDGWTCELPVSEEGSGVKWRLVWVSHVKDPIAQVVDDGELVDAKLLYTDEWDSVDAVLAEAVRTRDERLALSRRLEKLSDQMPLHAAQRHLLHLSHHNFLANTYWCKLPDASKPRAKNPYAEPGEHVAPARQWFSVTDGSKGYHSPLDVEYNNSLWYLTFWPQLLAMQFDQWARLATEHRGSGGALLQHDLGKLPALGRSAYPHQMPVEETANFLLLMQTYTRWTGDSIAAKRHLPLIRKLAAYLRWTDREDSGYPSQGVANTVVDAGPALQLAHQQVYLAIKRAAALRAAADLLALSAHLEEAMQLDKTAEHALTRIEATAWRGDHYAVCTDESAVGINDPRTGKPLPFAQFSGVDAYSIYTTNGLLLPAMVGQPPLLDPARVRADVLGAVRENFGRYGCSHTSDEPDRLRISQNLWRDVTASYLHVGFADLTGYYWDLQTASNTFGQSLGFVDAYMNDDLFFMSRGVTTFGLTLAGPLLVIDRLAPGGCYITVNPNRHRAQRWPLFALADWKAGKVPICVVDGEGRASIEGRIDPVIVQGQIRPDSDSPSLIG